MAYLNWLDSEWKVFWHACSGHGLSEQCLCIWNAKTHSTDTEYIFTYPIVKSGMDAIKVEFADPTLNWEELEPAVNKWLQEMEELYESFIQD